MDARNAAREKIEQSRKQLVDLGNHAVSGLLHIVGEALLIVLGNLVILFELLDRIEPIATDMAYRNFCRLGIFVRNFYKLLAAFLIELGNSKPKHLSFGRRT